MAQTYTNIWWPNGLVPSVCMEPNDYADMSLNPQEHSFGFRLNRRTITGDIHFSSNINTIDL